MRVIPVIDYMALAMLIGFFFSGLGSLIQDMRYRNSPSWRNLDSYRGLVRVFSWPQYFLIAAICLIWLLI